MTDYSLLFKPEYYRKAFETNHFSEKKLVAVRYSNAVVLPAKVLKTKNQNGTNVGGGIVTENGEYLDSTALHNGSGGVYPYTKPREYVEKAVYLGMYNPVWGHCITDNIKRFWFLKSEEYKNYYSDWKLIYVPYPDFSISDSFRRLICILGIDIDKLEPVCQITGFRELILPDECFFTEGGGTRYFTREYRDLIDEVRNYALDHRTPIANDKFYFFYAGYHRGGKVIGEEKLARFFASQGYTVVAPEKHSLEEQLNILVNAKEFASTIGSCSHNMLFLQDHTKVTLIPRANYLTGYQRAIDDVHDLDITYVDSSLSFMCNEYPWDGPFYFFVSSNLRKLFSVSDNNWSKKNNDKGFIKYCHHAMRWRSFTECKKAITYYLDELIMCCDREKERSFIYRFSTILYKAINKLKNTVKGCIHKIGQD